eukprot:7237125-Prymnesium_polylepis.1
MGSTERACGTGVAKWPVLVGPFARRVAWDGLREYQGPLQSRGAAPTASLHAHPHARRATRGRLPSSHEGDSTFQSSA